MHRNQPSSPAYFLLFALFAASLLLTRLPPPGDTPPPAIRPWGPADVRLLDAPDAADPALDLTALYTRQAGSDLEIRLDLLEIDPPTPAAADIYIAIDYAPGGADALLLSPEPFKAKCVCTLTQAKIEWDLLIIAPAQGAPRAFVEGQLRASERIRPRVARDPQLDTVTISLNRASLPAFRLPPKIEVFSAAPGQYDAADRLGPVALDTVSSQRVPLLLAFWNVFEAPTPALALRRWDGAHTGPRGERHGLRHLLDAAEAHRIPLALLDVKTPARLSALDTVGGVERLRGLLGQNLLILPDTAYGDPASVALDDSRAAARRFGLPISPACYGSTADPAAGCRYRFVSLPDVDQPARRDGVTLLPLPPDEAWRQPSPDGPSLELRRALLEAALSPSPDAMLILGGDLRQSAWGSPDHAGPTLAYFAARPYVRPISENDLAALSAPVLLEDVALPAPAFNPAFYTSQGAPTGQDADSLRRILLARLRQAPANPIRGSAWELFFALTAPNGDEALAALRAQYLGDVGLLLEAARWAEAPHPRSDCASDPDLDGMQECILATDRYFAIIEPDGARLAYFFARNDQLVGPTWQFAAGVSDPRAWDSTLGPAADPAQTPGAFVDAGDAFRMYHPGEPALSKIRFTAADGMSAKTFSLDDRGLEVVFEGSLPASTRLTLTVSPQARLRPGWLSAYQWTQADGVARWGPAQGPRLAVQAAGLAGSRRFDEGWVWMRLPENPNRSYPTGFTLPFPLAVVEITPLDKPVRLTVEN